MALTHAKISVNLFLQKARAYLESQLKGVQLFCSKKEVPTAFYNN
jgi:hypothetical protein